MKMKEARFPWSWNLVLKAAWPNSSSKNNNNKGSDEQRAARLAGKALSGRMVNAIAVSTQIEVGGKSEACIYWVSAGAVGAIDIDSTEITGNETWHVQYQRLEGECIRACRVDS